MNSECDRVTRPITKGRAYLRKEVFILSYQNANGKFQPAFVKTDVLRTGARVDRRGRSTAESHRATPTERRYGRERRLNGDS